MQIESNGIMVQETGVTPHWHALYTRHQHEKHVARSLMSKDHCIFLPTYGVARRWSDRTKQVWLPLFPCYVFVCGGMDRQLELLTTPGVVGILQSSGRPAMIPLEQIDAIRQIVEGSLQIEPHPFLACGDRVRVTAGPLTGLEGILVRKKGVSKLIVSVELLCQSVAAEIDSSCVEGIGHRPMEIKSYSVSIPS
jgi:transcription antitermination factor NusG